MKKLLVTLGLILLVFLSGVSTGWEMPLSKALFVLGALLIALANIRTLRLWRLTINNGYLMWNWPVWNMETRHGRKENESWFQVSCFEFVWK